MSLAFTYLFVLVKNYRANINKYFTLFSKNRKDKCYIFVLFQMPLSKKLKANAMAALFKTQSGFTVKRKGSTSSLMSAGE